MIRYDDNIFSDDLMLLHSKINYILLREYLSQQKIVFQSFIIESYPEPPMIRLSINFWFRHRPDKRLVGFNFE